MFCSGSVSSKDSCHPERSEGAEAGFSSGPLVATAPSGGPLPSRCCSSRLRFLFPHHPGLHPGMLALEHLLGDLVGPDVVVVEHRGKLLLDPPARLAAEEIGQLDCASSFLFAARLPRWSAAPPGHRQRP